MAVLARLRALPRRRALTGGGAVVALALAIVAAPRSPASGSATTSVVLDTPRSQVVAADPFGTYSLTWRAKLIAHLMASEKVKRRLVGELGIEPGELTVVDPALSVPRVPDSLSKAASEAATTTATPYTLTAYLEDDSLPIVTLLANAPEEASAAALASAAAAISRARTTAPEAPADVSLADAKGQAAEIVPRAVEGFVVDNLAPIRVKEVAGAIDPLEIVGTFVRVFGAWCAALALASLVKYTLRARGGPIAAPLTRAFRSRTP